jgi:nucleoside-diphosphate-sugar epimerase
MSIDAASLGVQIHGGMGFIERNKALCMLSSLINTHLLIESNAASVQKFFFASSACVYASWHQNSDGPSSLAEGDAYPADPEDGYGWEKLYAERMCRHFREDFGLETRIARYHNVYGPLGTYDGGREKAPAAACRKLAQFSLGSIDEIEIWGDGGQVRSFTYIDDCIEGTLRLMQSAFAEPLNIGSSESVTINQLYSLAADIAGVHQPKYAYELNAPLGVRGRSSDNTLCQSVLGWQPNTSLAEGLSPTYEWIHQQVVETTHRQDKLT